MARLHSVAFGPQQDVGQYGQGRAGVARLKEPKRLTAQGKGQSDPIAPNTTADGRQQNRRTEIVLVRASDAM